MPKVRMFAQSGHPGSLKQTRSFLIASDFAKMIQQKKYCEKKQGRAELGRSVIETFLHTSCANELGRPVLEL
jgi:hypothetical protein